MFPEDTGHLTELQKIAQALHNYTEEVEVTVDTARDLNELRRNLDTIGDMNIAMHEKNAELANEM